MMQKSSWQSLTTGQRQEVTQRLNKASGYQSFDKFSSKEENLNTAMGGHNIAPPRLS